jgi:hypothetical protein
LPGFRTVNENVKIKLKKAYSELKFDIRLNKESGFDTFMEMVQVMNQVAVEVMKFTIYMFFIV